MQLSSLEKSLILHDQCHIVFSSLLTKYDSYFFFCLLITATSSGKKEGQINRYNFIVHAAQFSIKLIKSKAIKLKKQGLNIVHNFVHDFTDLKMNKIVYL